MRQMMDSRFARSPAMGAMLSGTVLSGTVLAIATGKILLHVATNWRYGFHRDELYYVAGGLHPSLGYVDHPPLVPLLGGLIYTLFGASLSALRFMPALAGGIVVLLAAGMAAELGGGRLARWVAALLVAISPVFLATNGMFQTVSFDQLAWAVVLLLLIRLLRTGNEQLWIALGLAFGVGLLIKYTIGLLAIGLLIGLILTPQRCWLRTRWPYLGAGIAGLIVLPNLIWQALHGWPTLEFIQNNSAEAREEFPPLVNLGFQALDAGPFVVPLVVVGIVTLIRREDGRFRTLGLMTIGIFIVHALLQAKHYYTAPLLPLLFAAGAVAFEGFVERRSWSWQPRAMAAGLVGVTLAFPLPFLVPMLPASTAQDVGIFEFNGDLAEMIGWPEYVDTIEQVYADLPPEERDKVIVLTGSYGEAAVLELLDDDAALPKVASAHNSYALWGSDTQDPETIIVTGYRDLGLLNQLFQDCRQVGTVTNELGIENELLGSPVHVCDPPVDGWDSVWDELRHFN